jgi:chorismate synthase
MLRYLTAGESHGRGLVGIIEGLPAGLSLSREDIDAELRRRQRGYGRGGRMKIEADRAEILSGVRWGQTIGSPICLFIENRDWPNWEKAMSAEEADAGSLGAVTRPRPGHADLPGALKYARKDIRDILERSSARETAMRVALGAVVKKFLREFGIGIGSFVTSIGDEGMELDTKRAFSSEDALLKLSVKAEASEARCPDRKATEKIKSVIDDAAKKGNTLGGRFTVFAAGVPPGLGSHTHWDRRLDGVFAQALMSIQAIKAVEIGEGAALAAMPGSAAMDEIYYAKDKGFFRKTNSMGGIEGGMTNGMPVVASAVMKPIPTLRKPLHSVDIRSKRPFEAAYERSDVCAVPAASVVAEAMTALALAGAFLEKMGGDSMEETKKNFDSYLRHLSRF